MLETQDQVKRALTAIIDYTKWSFREVGKQSGINFATISRIADSADYMPQRRTRELLYKLKLRVDGMELAARNE